MKYSILLLFAFSINFSFAQTGKITFKNSINNNRTFIYEPKESLIIPENAVIYSLIIDKDSKKKELPLTKVGNHYEFFANISDSVNIAFFTINISSKKVIDDNNGKSYIVYFKNQTKQEQENSLIAEMTNTHYSFNVLNLKTSNSDVLDRYQKALIENPSLKNTQSYIVYITLKYQESPTEELKAEMLALAKQYKNSATNEDDLLQSYYLFWNFRLDKEIAEIEEMGSKKFPNGFLACRFFMKNFYTIENRSDSLVYAKFIEFNKQFPKYKIQGDGILFSLIDKYLSVNNLSKLEELEKNIQNKMDVANTYNNYAWDIAIKDTLNEVKMAFAAAISKKSIDITSKIITDKAENVEDYETGKKNTFLDTYAYILNNQKKYEEAYNIESQIKQEGDAWINERTAIYAENYKGQLFAKAFLEQTMKKTGGSEAMLKQLKNIYLKQNLPLTQFEEIKTIANRFNTQKVQNEIIERFGSLKAPTFSLKNLENKIVSLDEQKGRLVVVDFWATWCGPCIASMPKMQEFATKYKDVKFLFIDTLESIDENETKIKVVELIKKNNYSFNVLFDTESKISTIYQVESIPNKIVIGKNGNILAINPSDDSLIAIFEENK